jgi:hypothetical protein
MDDPGWVAGVTALARSLKLHVVRGPWWQAPTPSVLPDWYRTEFENKSGETAVYITKTPATAREVEAICARQGRITIAEESRLLGYPICCVEGHYARQIAMDELFGLLLQRVSGGDEEMMRRIAQDDVQMSIETEEEAALHQRVNGSSIVPFTSVMSCPACSAAADSPAQKLSQRFEELARSVGRGLLDDVQASQRAYNEEQAD